MRTYVDKNFLVIEIEEKIRKGEEKKKDAVVLMIISIFFLWPLMIVGAVMHDNACKEINKLNEEKKRIMFEDYFNKEIRP